LPLGCLQGGTLGLFGAGADREAKYRERLLDSLSLFRTHTYTHTHTHTHKHTHTHTHTHTLKSCSMKMTASPNGSSGGSISGGPIAPYNQPGGNSRANGWFLWSTPIQTPSRRGGICARLTWDLPTTRLQGGAPVVSDEDDFLFEGVVRGGHERGPDCCPALCTLHPTSYTLHPKPQTFSGI